MRVGESFWLSLRTKRTRISSSNWKIIGAIGVRGGKTDKRDNVEKERHCRKAMQGELAFKWFCIATIERRKHGGRSLEWPICVILRQTRQLQWKG